MKIVLEIKDSKADFVMELLKNLSFVKTRPLVSKKNKIAEDLEEAIHEVNLAKQGKIKLKTAQELLDEL
ncbi:MAG: hypothetical protein KF900_13310 [Bacteroidetes bacterium]|nr:hypothetical protein [Bacteroidota bacterium]